MLPSCGLYKLNCSLNYVNTFTVDTRRDTVVAWPTAEISTTLTATDESPKSCYCRAADIVGSGSGTPAIQCMFV